MNSKNSKSRLAHNIVSLTKKVEVIKRVEKGELLNVVASDFGVSRNTVRDWFRDRNRIEQNYAYYTEVSSTRKSMKTKYVS